MFSKPPDHEPSKGRRESTSPAQSEREISLRFFFPPRVLQSGKAQTAEILLDPFSVMGVATWDQSLRRWREDTAVLGLSKRGQALSDGLAKHTCPNDAQKVSSIVTAILFENLVGEPVKLREMIRRLAPNLGDLDSFSFTAPVPWYHASGLSKDVYQLSVFALPADSRSAFREFKFALKLSRDVGSIDKCEIDFHTQLCQLQGPNTTTVSRVLGVWSLNSAPELNYQGKTVVLEVFEEGITPAHYLDSKAHQPAACATAVCAFRLFDLCVKAAHNLDFATSLSEHNPILAKFPCDINPGNFVLRPNGSGLCVDLGRHHGKHSFSDVLLRLIYEYCHLSEQPHSLEQGRGLMISLFPLFQTIERVYGRARCNVLIRDFITHLGVLLGTPRERLKEFNATGRVDLIGDYLAARHAASSSDFDSDYVSRNIRAARGQLRRGLNQQAEVGRYEFEELWYSLRSLPLWFSDGQLRTIFQDAKRFLGGFQSRSYEEQSWRESCLAYERRAKAFSSHIYKSPKKNCLPFSQLASDLSLRSGWYSALSVWLFTHFPNVGAVQAGWFAISLAPSAVSDRIKSGPGVVSFAQRLLLVANEISSVQAEANFDASVVEYHYSMICSQIKKRVQMDSASFLDPANFGPVMEVFLGFIIALQRVYENQGLGVFNEYREESQWWPVVNQVLLTGAGAIVKEIKDSPLAQVGAGLAELSPGELLAIRLAGARLTKIILAGNFGFDSLSMPQHT